MCRDHIQFIYLKDKNITLNINSINCSNNFSVYNTSRINILGKENTTNTSHNHNMLKA